MPAEPGPLSPHRPRAGVITGLALALACLVAACGPASTGPAAPADPAAAPSTVPALPEPPGPAGAPDPADPAAIPEPEPPPALPTVGTSSAAASRGNDPDSPFLRAVRTGVQPGADRLVFEFEGQGLPQWHIEYIDRPVHECGSGDVVPLPGDAWLMVRFSGARAHTDAGMGTTGPKLRTLDQANLLALARTCDFEGEVTWVAGVRSPEGYTPRVLAGPARLVVDIAHPSPRRSGGP